jgi:hypothetical protein
MATDTDTILSESGSTATPEATRPPWARGPRHWDVKLVWAAIVAAGIAVAALAVTSFTGGDDDSDIRAWRLAERAEQVEREAHLEGQAKTYGGRHDSPNASDAARYRAAQQAEAAERQAHLEGQAKTHGGDDGLPNPFDAGNRAAYDARAKAYVGSDDQSESNASGGDPSNDEFVPGSRHMPTR